MGDWRPLLGIITLLAIAYLLGKNKKQVNWRTIIIGIALQFFFAYLVLHNDWVRSGFDKISLAVVQFLEVSRAGADFVLGKWPENLQVYSLQFKNGKEVSEIFQVGFVFAFKVLPVIIFFSAFSSLLYYFGVLQKMVQILAWVMQKSMGLSGAESLAAAANIFIGQTEAPLLVKPYIHKMTESEILSLMVGGMATIAGSVLAAYIGFLGQGDPEQQLLFTKHLLAASVMSAPAAIVVAKLMIPETEKIVRTAKINDDKIGSNMLDAIANGTTDGLKLAVNVGAMLLVFTALLAVFNWMLSGIAETHFLAPGQGSWNQWVEVYTGGRFQHFDLQFILAKLFTPLAWLIGVAGEDTLLVGQLLGEKTVLNEFFAYATLKDKMAQNEFQDPKSIIIATYALCGFANFASIGIQIGGIGVLAPSKRHLLAKLGFKALIGGTIATLLTGAIAGLLLQGS